MPATTRKNTPRAPRWRHETRNHLVLRDPRQGPRDGHQQTPWVGGFATEEEAKAARDEARVKARHGEYIDRNRITVAAYLDDWIDSHAMEIKPRTLPTTAPASGSMSRRRSATCRSRPSGRPRSPSSTATC